MHGKKTTLQDITLDLKPTTEIDLTCYESLDSSEDEDETDSHLDRQAERECYRIVTDCTKCQCTVCLAIESNKADLRVIEDLLMGALGIVCPNCSRNL
ncbi:E7 protein [human papillomavirus 73]|uniref:Protein E7 n=1 Tax=Human papillomavirus 73 TaxID=51033 RepID=A0A0P0EFU4_HPV73|nr:early protein E7 [human papillomavirus 73]ALJ32604.1 early protein E7 [human papillomavirus 73]ALJ32612.1 early protein E7 [human papillomavirus 73]ALJ32620.1 early protein E7 [human papillomavirus 73]ALJ32628.1 early protein E7 [human papillomavirus 73]